MKLHTTFAAALISTCIIARLPAQQSARSRILPITSPIRRAGVYHVATGSWTRNASLANVTGPDTIYNNSCAVVYYAPVAPTESIQHRSRIPSTSGPTTPSVYYGTQRNDEAPGCHDAYTINGFEVAYCSSSASPVTWTFQFASSYALCDSGDMVPDFTIVVTGLPGGCTTCNGSCWIVDVDLSGSSGGGIVLSADGDGSYTGPSSADQFGWSFSQDQPYSTFTGPLIAGDFTWTGGTLSGVLTPCAGTDGTIWDNPINLGEEGTGMSSNDFFRAAATPGPVHFSSGPGCYSFGRNPHSDFWLKLFADPQCPSGPFIYDFCFPGEAGIHACTTCSPANPPVAHGRGCNNFGQHTGGAQLSEAGNPRISHDTVVLSSSFENDSALTVLMQGTATTNVVYGAGVRCIGGLLKRLYTGQAGSAANGDPAGVFHRPGAADSTPVHTASANAGFVINPPITLYYQAYYRDPNASPTCGGASSNATQAGSLNWTP
jgi:hypothetical protein